MYKMIVIDLDGTLLDDQKEVSQEDADMINRAYREKGVICVISTGRSYMCAKYIANLVGEGLSQYIIASTGSIIKDNRNNIYLNKQSISYEDTMKILKLMQEYNFRYMIDISSKTISNDRLVNQNNLKKIGMVFEIKKDIIDYFENNETDSIEITIVGKPEELLEVIEKLKELGSVGVTDLCKTLDVREDGTEELTYIDIMSEGSTKKNAIQILAKHLNIDNDEIIVIGDGGNDIPMFEVAGLKVAMSNALDIVKKEADYITSSNNESGVAKAIKKFIFNEE